MISTPQCCGWGQCRQHEGVRGVWQRVNVRAYEDEGTLPDSFAKPFTVHPQLSKPLWTRTTNDQFYSGRQNIKIGSSDISKV